MLANWRAAQSWTNDSTMATRTISQKLRTLVDYLDGLTERATIDGLDAQLRAANVSIDDVAAFVRFNDHRYLRNLVCEGPWYHLLVLCWKSGQRSPIHNHAGSTCGFKVLKGEVTETRFDMTPAKIVHPVSTHPLPAGELAVTQDADIHQMSNLQAPSLDVVTLHIYSPPLFRMDTYSLTDSKVSDFRPMVLESAGSGI